MGKVANKLVACTNAFLAKKSSGRNELDRYNGNMSLRSAPPHLEEVYEQTLTFDGFGIGLSLEDGLSIRPL